MNLTRRQTRPVLMLLLVLCLGGGFALAAPASRDTEPAASKTAQPPARPDHSGKTRKGKASYYSHHFSGKKMANGKPMKPDSNVAASKTLPLGTKARVTNLDNGKSAVVVVQDRGPYVKGRIVDVTPATADKLDMKKDGVVPVEVKPLQLPQAAGAAPVPAPQK